MRIACSSFTFNTIFRTWTPSMHNVHRTSAKTLYINDLAHGIFRGKDVDEFHISQNFEGKAVNAYNWDSGRCMGRVKSKEGVQKVDMDTGIGQTRVKKNLADEST